MVMIVHFLHLFNSLSAPKIIPWIMCCTFVLLYTKTHAQIPCTRKLTFSTNCLFQCHQYALYAFFMPLVTQQSADLWRALLDTGHFQSITKAFNQYFVTKKRLQNWADKQAEMWFQSFNIIDPLLKIMPWHNRDIIDSAGLKMDPSWVQVSHTF